MGLNVPVCARLRNVSPTPDPSQRTDVPHQVEPPVADANPTIAGRKLAIVLRHHLARATDCWTSSAVKGSSSVRPGNNPTDQ